MDPNPTGTNGGPITSASECIQNQLQRGVVLSSLLETDHYESLIKELTCTKCNKYMKPPVHLCVDGHSICGPCYSKSYQCHVCEKEFAPIRPIVLESLANKILFPCTNAGCPKHANLPALERHTPHCQYRIINCFMTRVYGECKWEGRAGEWMDHCFTDHPQRVAELPFITVKDKWDAKRTDPVLNYFLLRCFDKVFNVYQIYDKRGGRMMWTVLVNDDQAEKFYFEVDLFLPNHPAKKILYRRPCKCEKDADFLEHTQNVYIPVENVLSMLDEDESTNFTVRIGYSWISPYHTPHNTDVIFSRRRRRPSLTQSIVEIGASGPRRASSSKANRREVENLPPLEPPSDCESPIPLLNDQHKGNENSEENEK